MKILTLHNEYLYPGGEDTVVDAETQMLRRHGHEVIFYQRFNKEIQDLPLWGKIKFYARDIYFDTAVYREVRALIQKQRPQLAQVHNSFFRIGPAAYEACFDAGVPVIQTLHNYRFLCAAATFFREGKVCEACCSQGRRAGIRYGCWQGSKMKTFWLTKVIESYERRGILSRIKLFLALSDFSRRKFIENGFAPERVVLKPNFLMPDPGRGPFLGKHFLYVGTLQGYKGVGTLLQAWRQAGLNFPFKVVGHGPLERELRQGAPAGVEWLGQQSQAAVMALMRQALGVVIPSECYENFPRVLAEAFACGVPVVASRLGALAELVASEETGLLFEAGDPASLAQCLKKLHADFSLAQAMGQQARQVFEQKYTELINYPKVIKIYEQVVA